MTARTLEATWALLLAAACVLIVVMAYEPWPQWMIEAAHHDVR